jgi:hypothetical protein
VGEAYSWSFPGIVGKLCGVGYQDEDAGVWIEDGGFDEKTGSELELGWR